MCYVIYVLCFCDETVVLDCKLLRAGALVLIYEPCLSSDIMVASIVKCMVRGMDPRYF